MKKDNLSPVENGSKRIYKMYKSKKNWVVAPVVLLTLLGAVAPAPIALTNVVNAEGETPATTTTSSSEATTSDSGATPETDNTVAPVEATIAAKKDAIFAIQNLELPKSLTAAEKEKVHAQNIKFKTQDDFIAEINEIADSAATQSVFDVLKAAYTQAAVAAYESFAPKVTSTKEKLAAVNGLEDKVSTATNAKTYLEYFNGKADATQTSVDNALTKFVADLTVKAGEVDRTLGTETKPAENNYQTVRATFDKVLADQTTELTNIYNAAVEQGKINTDYNAKKADAAKRINDLPNLTAAERNQYLADVNKVAADNDDTRTDNNLTTIRDWKTELEDIVKNATRTNNQHVTDLITTVTNYLDGQAKDSLDQTIPVYLSADTVKDYKDQVNKFANTTEVRGIDTNLNKVTDLQTLFDKIKKANEDATVNYKLNSLKQQYIAAINNKDDADYALLTEPTRQAYVHRISDAAVTTSAQVRDIFAEYKDALEVAKLLHDNTTLDELKNAGYDKVKDLKNIADLVKGNYQFAIKSASTKDEVVSIFKEALAANRAALRAAQDAAIKDINALPFLTDAEKKDYAAEITRDFNADGTIRDITLDDVATIRTAAINKNAAAELNAAKYDAKKTVQGLKYLSNEQVGTYLTSIDAAQTVDAVKTIVAEAIKANFTAGVENALTVKEAQEIATEAINSLDALTAAEKADALKDVADAKTKEDVLKAYQAADKTNTANIEAARRAAKLAEEKENAIKAINAFKYLTADQKADYVARVKAAANSDDVKDVLSKATNDDKIGFEAFKQLEAAKTNAVKLIRGDYDKGEEAGYETSAYKSDVTTFGSLVYLTNEQKANYVAKILAAKSIGEVDKLVDDAYYTNLNQITDRKEFDEVASELVKASKYLNPSQKAGYVSSLTAAKDIDAAKKVLKEAVDKGYEQNDKLVMKEIDSLLSSGLYNTAKTKLAALRLDSNISTYTAKVQGLLDLREAKEKAVNEITAADYVSDKDKENLINSVNKATSVADVNKVLDQLKDLQPATVVQLYRAYNPNSGEHLYTADKAEYDHLVSLGWKGEGDAWKAASKGAPVYRLYNPNSGEHFYTVSESEYNDVAKAGWKKEGVAFYSDANRGVEVFRLFNPNAKGAGSHHYTTLASERDDLIKAGWKYENVAFYGLK